MKKCLILSSVLLLSMSISAQTLTSIETTPTTVNGTYQNPVIPYNAPDPTIIRAADGKFYLYTTEDTRHVPIYMSTDMVKWYIVGQAFTDATRPNWNPGNIWAPDINYINGKYVMYYSMSQWGGEWACGIGVAVADRPTGPFKSPDGTDGKLFISSEIGVQNSIDPLYIEVGTHKYLFWGSFRGINGIELSEDGLSIMPGAVKKQIAGTYTEGTYIIQHDGYFYLIGSAGSCCNGLSSTYHMVMARSQNIMGPYLNKAGGRALDNQFSPLLNASPEVAGPGHCSEFIQDDAGQYWVLYHGYQTSSPDKGRQAYLDKVFWDQNGWPYMTGSQPSTISSSPTIVSPTGIDEITNPHSKQVQIDKYVKSLLSIRMKDGSDFSWQLVDLDGKTVKKGKAKGVANINCYDIQLGMYIVNVAGNTGKICEKMIKY